MEINKTDEGGKIILALSGKLSVNTAPQFQETLISAFDGAKEIVLDFNELVFVSSAGLRVLLIGQETASEKRVPMSVHNVQEAVMEVFDMTGFSNILTIV